MGLSGFFVAVIRWVLNGKRRGVEPVVGLLGVCFALKLSKEYARNVEIKLLNPREPKGRSLINEILYRWV